MNKTNNVSLINKLSKKYFIIILIYIIYRFINVFLIDLLYDKNNIIFIGKEFAVSENINKTFWIDFENPPPMINDVIDYNSLAFCHKCMISPQEYEKNSNYELQIIKFNFSVIFLPWTQKIDFLKPNNCNLKYQFGVYNNNVYDILVYTGVNVFSKMPEELIFYWSYNTIIMILLFPLLISITIEFIIFLLKSEFMKCNVGNSNRK